MEKITGVVSAWNAQDKLDRCLSSLSFVDELIVVDNSSTDSTARIAKKYKAKVYNRPNYPMLNTNKNFGFEQATGEWILNLDADEEVPKELAREIKERIQKITLNGQANIVGFWIPRKNIIFGKEIKHGLWWPDRHLRLFARGKGKFLCKHVHEYLHVDGPTDELTTPFIHHNYESISQYLRKMDTIYTESEVQNLLATQYQLAWYDAIRFPASDFIKIFFAQRGYKDGLHGLVLAVLQSFYSFVVFAKLWERNRFPERSITLSSVDSEFSRAAGEFTYWRLTAYIGQSESPFTQLLLRLQRKFRNLLN